MHILDEEVLLIGATRPSCRKGIQAFGSGQAESCSKRYAAQLTDHEEDTAVDSSNLEYENLVL